MAATLPVKKLYFDSRFKTKGSVSNSQCKFELSESISLPNNCVCYIDDVIIPHSFFTVEDYNNKLYFRKLLTNGSQVDKIITIPVQNHTGVTIAAAIKSGLDAAFGSAEFTCVYNERKGTLTITLNISGETFLIFSDDDLADNVYGSWTGPAFDTNNPKSANEIIRVSGTATEMTVYESGFLDLRNVHNIYITSPNLGHFTSIGPRGERNIVKKVPVSADFGYVIYDSVVSSHDYIDVGKSFLRTIELNLRDVHGNIINLHGANWSCSIIMSTIKEDI